MLFETKNLTFGYIKKPLLFSGVNLSIDSGVIFVTGMEGSGKSTLLKVLCNMEDMYLGEVLIEGKKPKDNTREITYLPDKPIFLENKSVIDNLKFAASAIDKTFEVKDADDWLIPKLKIKAKKLSNLERYILALKRAEIKNAKLVLLDLCFDGLSDAEIDEYISYLNKLFAMKNRLVIVAISAKDYKLLNYCENNSKFLHIFMGKANYFSNFAEFTAKISDSSMAEYTNLVKYQAEIVANENGYFLHLENKVLKLEEKYIKGVLSYFEVSSTAKVSLYSDENVIELSEKQLFEKLDNKTALIFDEISYEILS